jgi:ribulose 1,5-bisphosphate synthetase/thiazole synthase
MRRNQDMSSDFVTETAKQRPVLYDVDVAIAGSGLCSTFAAIAAGRCGAKTLVIERFGTLGGNIGPGMMVMGSLYYEAEVSLPGGVAGIAKEFVQRLQKLRARGEPGESNIDWGGYPYAEETNIASYLAYDMMRAAGVEILLSAYASDPIVEDGVVHGLFVECKSGRVAVKARVTIDGTGYAGIARRAGAPIIPYLERREEYARYILRRERHYSKQHPTYYNDTELFCLIGGVDLKRFEAFCAKEVPLSDDDRAWAESSGFLSRYPKALIKPFREVWENGSFRPHSEPYPGVRIVTGYRFASQGSGIAKLLISCNGAVDSVDAKQTSHIEAEMRALVFEAVTFYRNHAEGFENAYVLMCAPFLGWRGGPHVDGEHTLSLEDRHYGRKFDDVLYRNTHLGQESHGGEPSGFDVPYRAVLPRNVDGLLVCGRGAAYLRRGHDPCAMRARPAMMVLGQAIGTAAAIAALDNVTPKDVDIRKVQKRLVAEGIYLGDENRLRELGLVHS